MPANASQGTTSFTRKNGFANKACILSDIGECLPNEAGGSPSEQALLRSVQQSPNQSVLRQELTCPPLFLLAWPQILEDADGYHKR